MNEHIDYLPEILATKGVTNPFRVPDQYFDHLFERIEGRIDHQILSSFHIQKPNPFKVPDYYFEHSIESVIQSIEESNNQNIQRFKMPDGYFDKMQSSVLSKVNQQTKKNVVRRWNFKNSQWAAAAMILVLLGVFLIKWNQQNLTSSFDLSQIDDETLIEYISSNDMDLNNLSEEVEFPIDTEVNPDNLDLDEDSLNDLINSL